MWYYKYDLYNTFLNIFATTAKWNEKSGYILLLRKLAQTWKLINFVQLANNLQLAPQFKDICRRIRFTQPPFNLGPLDKATTRWKKLIWQPQWPCIPKWGIFCQSPNSSDLLITFRHRVCRFLNCKVTHDNALCETHQQAESSRFEVPTEP